MPISDQFVFTDPVAAEQAVRMADIDRARAEAQGRALAATVQALAQGGRGQQDRQFQMYQLAQQQAEAERNRQARAAELGQSIASQEKIAGMQTTGRQEERKQDQMFNALLTEIQSEDPPTDSELDARSVGLAPHLQSILKSRAANIRNTLNSRFDLADNVARNWQSRLEAVPIDPKSGKRDPYRVKSLVDEARKSKEGSFITFDEGTQTFSPILRRPRADLLPGDIGGPPVQGPVIPPIRSIEQLRNQLAPPPAVGGSAWGLPPWLGNIGAAQAAQIPNEFMGGLESGAAARAAMPPAYVPPNLYEMLGSPIPIR